jgi:hypothetical protein
MKEKTLSELSGIKPKVKRLHELVARLTQAVRTLAKPNILTCIHGCPHFDKNFCCNFKVGCVHIPEDIRNLLRDLV